MKLNHVIKSELQPI